MIADLLGWIGFITNVWGHLALIKKSSSGWIVRLVSNAAWIIYAAQAQTWALLANHTVFAVLNVYGWYKWKSEDSNE